MRGRTPLILAAGVGAVALVAAGCTSTPSEGGTESIAIHSVGNLALTWDHRAFDGAYAAAFLHKIKELLETRDWSAEL